MTFDPDYLKDPETWTNVLREHQATIAAQVSRIEELEAVLQDCADDLETLTEHEYRGYRDDAGKMHPAMQPKFERDMALVHRVRALLSLQK